MFVLGIESSCDETAAAVVSDGKLLSNVIASQIKDHSAYGGVVPEIASRKHIEAVSSVIARAMAEAGIDLKAIDGIAVTRGPGLIGSLLVGLSAAKALAYGLEDSLCWGESSGRAYHGFLSSRQKAWVSFYRLGCFRWSHQYLSGSKLP